MQCNILNYPERVHVELTSRCNFKCLTCKHGYESYGEDLDDDVCDVLVNEIIPNLKEIELQGTGESLLSHNFSKVFNAAIESKNCRLILITNASLLTDEYIEKMVESNMQLVVSLDGSDIETFKMHRPIGIFEIVIKNLYKIQAHREKIGNTDFSFVINTVVTRKNLKKLRNMIDLASNIGVDYLFASEVRECMPNKRMWDEFRLDNYENREQLNKLIIECKEYAKGKNVGFNFNPYLEEKAQKKKVCISPWKHIFIFANGDVSVCCELNKKFGNIKADGFKNIWNSEKLNDFRNNMLFQDYDKHCLECCLPWGITYE